MKDGGKNQRSEKIIEGGMIVRHFCDRSDNTTTLRQQLHGLHRLYQVHRIYTPFTPITAADRRSY